VQYTNNPIRKTVLKELALFLALLFLGLVILPITIFLVGQQIFGEYGGAGFSGFFNSLASKLRDGNWVAWLLVLAPYLAWQSIRLTRFLWRAAGRPHTGSTTARN
jgi:hypothetical protein